jgi:pyruvate formate lyase activating enzyme
LGIKTVAVTNGYICKEPRHEFFSHIDATRVDLKGFTETFYKNITGSSLHAILDTLVYLKSTKIWLEIICLLIPGENDSSDEIEKSTKWVVDNLGHYVPMHFTAFYPAWKMQHKNKTPLKTLLNARDIASKNGVFYAYIGNLDSSDGGKTFCHNCKKCVISREYYLIAEYNLNSEGKCKFCKAKCFGVFD